MGDEIYVAFWTSIVPRIIDELKAGNRVIHFPVNDLASFGKRESYYANFRIVNGQLEIPRNAYAHGRDLYGVLTSQPYFQEYLSDKIIQVTITKNLELKLEVLKPGAPEFFTEEDFFMLSRFAGTKMEKANEEHNATYKSLKETYAKTAYWAREVQKKLFPEGSVRIIQKPTNQASRFESYQWARIYPDKEATKFEALAFTVGIELDGDFVVKIDTVGLGENNKNRKEYLKVRGDFKSSSIVKLLPKDNVLNEGWKQLIDQSSDLIIQLKPEYDELYNLLKGPHYEKISETKNSNMLALNTILYGPPGTGKTYSTVNRALQIIDRKFFEENMDDREKLTAEYRKYLIDWEKEQGQIAFCTFHQSLSYEDFIEGIKPIEPKEGESFIQYKVVDGIFKKICLLAGKRTSTSSFDNSYEQFVNDIIENSNTVSLKTPKQQKPFVAKVNSNNNIVAVPQTEAATQMVVTKEMIKDYLFEGKIRDWKPYTVALADYLKGRYPFSIEESNNTHKPFVLIIDEINRGNVSQIFGELITLIEPDKRNGNREEISLILPYSKASFSVPANVFIVGTMNTADRSVEALDTALRRRFAFEEMLPASDLLSPKHMLCSFWNLPEHVDIYVDKWLQEPYFSKASDFYQLIGFSREREKKVYDENYEDDRIHWIPEDLTLLTDDDFTGLNLQKLLEVINIRVETLLTKDHKIGHAWFMRVYSLDDLRATFKNKILPLLQEYFYNNYAKIGLVLGNNFFEEQKKLDTKLFASFKGGTELAEDYNDKIIYRFKNVAELTLEDFKSIYQ